MNRINEIGDTKKGQEMLGRTAERAYQRAARTSGADKQRYMKTYNDAYKTGGKAANAHHDGTRKHFDNGRDYEYEKWADEHNGNVAESKNMNKKLIRLTESDLHRIVKESVSKILMEGLKDTPFKGTHEDEDGALYMPDFDMRYMPNDDYIEGTPYVIITYNGEEEVDRHYVMLPKSGLHAYDDEVPFSLGSNQALIELD